MANKTFELFEDNFSVDGSALAKRIMKEAYNSAYALDIIFNSGNDALNKPNYYKNKYMRYAALYCMKYVNAILSAPLFLSRAEDKRNYVNPQMSLDQGFGLCGQIVSAYIYIAEMIGIECRYLQLFKQDAKRTDAGHVAVEVKIDGKWCYIDPSYASYAINPSNKNEIISADDMINGANFEIISNLTDPWLQEWVREYGNPIESIFDDQHLDIIYDGNGTCKIPLDGFEYNFLGKINSIGRNVVYDKKVGNIYLNFDVPADKKN